MNFKFHCFSTVIQFLLSFGGLSLDSNDPERFSNLRGAVRDFGGVGFLEKLTGLSGFGRRPYGERLGPVVWESIEELPIGVEYDFIIVGGEWFTLIHEFE
jgi:hypothetical protein